MQMARFLVEAVVLGKQSPNQLVREHPISRSWFYELLARYRQDGPAALERRSHRPSFCPHQVNQSVVDAILELRAGLAAAGLDAGAQTILHHLAARFPNPPSRVTVWRILRQIDATEWRLADSSKVEILNLIDDHSRLCLVSFGVRTVKAADALHTFYSAVEA